MKTVHVRQSQNHMSTTFDLTVSCEAERSAAADSALTRAHALIEKLERELSEFLPESPVHRLNHSGTNEKIPFPASALTLLALSARLREQTRGAFNAEAKSSAPEVSGIAWDECSAWKLNPGARLSFGAIGKGFALDRVKLELEQSGFSDFLLSGGGSSIVISGFAAPGDPWNWAWSWRKDSEGADLGVRLSHPSGAPVAIGVSGRQERGDHILDPRVGALKTKSRIESSLIGHSSAAEADALSTALFVSGWSEGIDTLSRLPASVAAASIDSEQIPRWNGTFRHWWGALAAFAFWMIPQTRADDSVDLSALGSSAFTPYITERNSAWILLPILSIALVLIHLMKIRRSRMKPPVEIKKTLPLVLAAFGLWATLEKAHAVEIEPLGKALQALLGTSKVFKKAVDMNGREATLFYSKDAAGKPQKVAFIEKGIYEPNCTHTWAIGIDSAKGTVTQVRVIEMSCPHAFPCKAATFLDQYKGKGPADVAKLNAQIQTIAKATGSSNLTSDAVKRSITDYSKLRGKI